MRKGLRSFDYGPTNTNLNVVDYVGRQGCHTWGYHNYPWGWVQSQVTHSLDTTSTLLITTLITYNN
jgi:hypothetical protein